MQFLTNSMQKKIWLYIFHLFLTNKYLNDINLIRHQEIIKNIIIMKNKKYNT